MQRLAIKTTCVTLTGLLFLSGCNGAEDDNGSGGGMADGGSTTSGTADSGAADGDATATNGADAGTTTGGTDGSTGTDETDGPTAGADTTDGDTTGGDGTCTGIGVATGIPDDLLAAIVAQFGKLNLSELVVLSALCNAMREGSPEVPGHSTGNDWAPSEIGQAIVVAKFTTYLSTTRGMPDEGEPAFQALELDADDLDLAFPCGDNGDALVLCVQDAPLPAGDYLVLGMAMESDLVLDDPNNAYQYGFVFDADGNTSNNYTPSPSFPEDFFQDTDRWYQVVFDNVGGRWSLDVVDWAGSSTIPDTTSAARVVLAGNAMIAIIPADEIGGEADVNCPPYRLTAFVHNGDFALDPPHFWGGDVEPVVGNGLDTTCD